MKPIKFLKMVSLIKDVNRSEENCRFLLRYYSGYLKLNVYIFNTTLVTIAKKIKVAGRGYNSLHSPINDDEVRMLLRVLQLLV